MVVISLVTTVKNCRPHVWGTSVLVYALYQRAMHFVVDPGLFYLR